MGPLQQGDCLRYEKALGEIWLAAARVGDDYCRVAIADYSPDYSSSWLRNAFIRVGLSRPTSVWRDYECISFVTQGSTSKSVILRSVRLSAEHRQERQNCITRVRLRVPK